MRYLSTSRLTVVTLQDRQGASLFVVPPELAALLAWFLGSEIPRLVALVTYCVIRRAALKYRQFIGYLAGWRDDLFIIRLAILDLLGVQIEGYATKGGLSYGKIS